MLSVNTRGHDSVFGASLGTMRRRLGAAYEIVDDCRQDITAWVEFLKSRVFPRIPVRKAEIERHMIEGERVATLWTATIALPSGREVEVPIFDFFRVEGGLIREIRPYFDPTPLKDVA